MKQKNARYGVVMFMCFIMLNPFFIVHFGDVDFIQDPYREENTMIYDPLNSGSRSNLDIIETILSKKLDQYKSEGYFSQLYEPSIQATYFAIKTLNTLGKRSEIDEDLMIEYFMSCIDLYTGLFMDDYARRYLTTNFTGVYYALTTVLEVNCYAILALQELGSLDLIDAQFFIDFIWSCYNPFTSGFIGQPFDTSLIDKLKLSTMDNTYYAVKTLDILMENWSFHETKVDEIASFTYGLQSSDGYFYNDEDLYFSSLNIYTESIVPSFYCIKTLEVLQMVNNIDLDLFHEYLENIYYPEEFVFRFYIVGEYDYYKHNFISTALALELSNLTGFESFNRWTTFQFFLSNRISNGSWNEGMNSDYHDLLTTSHIIQSLSHINLLSNLTQVEIDEISSSISSYFDGYRGYFIRPREFTLMSHLNGLTNSLKWFNQINELNIDTIYNEILDTGNDKDFSNTIGVNSRTVGFHVYPLEMYDVGIYDSNEDLRCLFSHESNFNALSILLKLSKLDELDDSHGLIDFITNIQESQFLEQGYEEQGGFLPGPDYKWRSLETQSKVVTLGQSYYTIRTLDLLTKFLGMGNITILSFNKAALYGYVRRSMVETDSLIYFKHDHEETIETILKNTYRMAYILKEINYLTLDTQKFVNFIVQNINYSNIKNLYYCYKLSEVLDLDFEFDLDMTHTLIQGIYGEELNEFYLTTERKEIKQEAFWWICEIARNSEFSIEWACDGSFRLGENHIISVSLRNMFLKQFDSDVSVSLDIEEIGTFTLERLYEGNYMKNLVIPEDPACFPRLEGFIKIHDKGMVVGQDPFVFHTNLQQSIEITYFKKESDIQFEINITREFYSGGPQPVIDSRVIANIYEGGNFSGSLDFNRDDHEEYSLFSLKIHWANDAPYQMNVSLIDAYFSEGLQIFSVFHNPLERDIPPEPSELMVNGIVISLATSITCGCLFLINIVHAKKREE